jgi:hypothetical protein
MNSDRKSGWIIGFKTPTKQENLVVFSFRDASANNSCAV